MGSFVDSILPSKRMGNRSQGGLGGVLGRLGSSGGVLGRRGRVWEVSGDGFGEPFWEVLRSIWGVVWYVFPISLSKPFWARF